MTESRKQPQADDMPMDFAKDYPRTRKKHAIIDLLRIEETKGEFVGFDTASQNYREHKQIAEFILSNWKWLKTIMERDDSC